MSVHVMRTPWTVVFVVVVRIPLSYVQLDVVCPFGQRFESGRGFCHAAHAFSVMSLGRGLIGTDLGPGEYNYP